MVHKNIFFGPGIAAVVLLLFSCGGNPAGPWHNSSDEDNQYVLTLGVEEDETFFQAAKLENHIYLVEAHEGTWELNKGNGQLDISITRS